MSQTVLMNSINECLSGLSVSGNTIIVLKGIPLSVVDPEGIVDFDALLSNKVAYLMKLFSERKFITYEEFLMMGQLLVEMYQNIIILNNNIYMEQYPIDIHYSDEIRNGLLNHFMETDDESEDHREVGNISEYIALYNGIREYNGFLLGAYCDEIVPVSDKIVKKNLFEWTDDKIDEIDEDGQQYIELIDEGDYISLVKLLFDEPDDIYVRISNYTGDLNRLRDHLNILDKYWKEWTDVHIVLPQRIEEGFESRPDYTDILKKYWGHDTFRMFKVYDMHKLSNGEKEVIEVSQERIISDIVQQAENCIAEDVGFRDVFVTAPTGAGKSVLFQIPAMYLAEKYNLLTIVISPLIGLMNDQVKNLEIKNYKHAKTINSDISPIIKQEILEHVANSDYHILYLSPETLLSRSAVKELIGDRTVGMIIIDEAHIVTTWGKQFRPDYWYLGDHIQKLRRTQLKEKGQAFMIATFTATAIYHGIEDMYTETINSLHMLNPITYLGYVKRNDIDIIIEKSKKDKNKRQEYEHDKDTKLEEIVKNASLFGRKTLVYFPTVALIGRSYEWLRARELAQYVSVYHGQLPKDEKAENYELFLNGDRPVMLATKAFGMGIDIDDIEVVMHFAPTGNVCDYVQEIGRAARREGLRGRAYYQYDSRDFKHINRLHGLSTIKEYQLIAVIERIVTLYRDNLNRGKRNVTTRRRNAMLLDAENFSYIFNSPVSNEDESINKVKTALLIIQKDFEGRTGFSPINVRPIPLFSMGYFAVEPTVQKRLLRKYHECLTEIDTRTHVCRIRLDKIWEKNYSTLSFPKFKYLLYSRSDELEFNKTYTIHTALCVSIETVDDYQSRFRTYWGKIQAFIDMKVMEGSFISVAEITSMLHKDCGLGRYKAQSVCDVLLASMDVFRKKYASSAAPIVREMTSNDGTTKYQFQVAVDTYFNWVRNRFKTITEELSNGTLFIVDMAGTRAREFSTVLGILDALEVLSFEMVGGANSQLYIYINQIQVLDNIVRSQRYKNRLLETVSERHLISVKMLTYLYENTFKNDEIWDILEDYFLGDIPEVVERACLLENPKMKFD